MSPNQLGATLVGAAGIFIVGSRTPDLGMSVAYLVSDLDSYQGLGYGLLGFALAILSGGGLVYWRQLIADRLFPSTAPGGTNVAEGPEALGFALLDLYFMVSRPAHPSGSDGLRYTQRRLQGRSGQQQTAGGDRMRQLNPALLAMLVVSIGTAFTAVASAEVVAIPGTKISLEPPPDFTLATQFPGVQNAELASSIMINELPAPVEELIAGFTKQGLLSRGMTLLTSEDVSIAARQGRLLSVTQVANGAIFEKWMAAFGNSSETVLVVATYPQTLAADLRAPMRSAVLSATWKPDAKLDPFEGLSFRIQESDHLKIQNRVQNMLLLAHPERTPSSPLSEPFAVVGSSYSPVRIDDLELFARQRITQTAQISDLRDIQGESVSVASRPAYEIIAKARDLKSGEALSVYQLVLVEGDTYYLMQGMVSDDRLNEYLPEFREIARSIEIR